MVPADKADIQSAMPSATEDLAALPDDQMLERYRKTRSPELGALIGARHGQMVFRTCLRRLTNVHDAEDATQAVFLTFVQRPDRVKGPLGAWLHEVARQTVHNMMRSRARRQHREEATVVSQAKTDQVPGTTDLREELDAALACLPGRLRGAVVARYLEGQAVGDAARSAGCDPGTFARRCTQGLERLRKILASRGLSIASVALVGFMTQEATAAAPAAVLGSVKATLTGAGAVSAPTVLLSKQVLSAMFWAKAKVVAGIVAGAIATTGAAVIVVPMILPSATSVRPAEGAKQVMLNLDFEDGFRPGICTAGRVVKGPERPGNLFCLEGDRTLLFEKSGGLFTHTEDLYLVFDLWVDSRVSTLDIHFWNGTQKASFGADPIRIPREKWVQGIVVRFNDFRSGETGPKPGDIISNLAIQAGQPDSKIYLDNVEVIRSPRLLAPPPEQKK